MFFFVLQSSLHFSKTSKRLLKTFSMFSKYLLCVESQDSIQFFSFAEDFKQFNVQVVVCSFRSVIESFSLFLNRSLYSLSSSFSIEWAFNVDILL